jgi:DnaJ-class molecular chaperone
MVRKETCPKCKGNKWVDIRKPDGHSKSIQCPDCAGEGYKVRIVLNPR